MDGPGSISKRTEDVVVTSYSQTTHGETLNETRRLSTEGVPVQGKDPHQVHVINQLHPYL